MLFSSFEFVLYFLPIVVAGYFVLPFRWGLKNMWLLAASIFFYAWGEPWFVLAMIGSIVFNYVAALFVSGRRWVLWADVAGNLALLFVFKYLNFVTGGLTHFVLPIGISFFTFQALSYVVDVYRGIPAQRNPLKVALYISFFPQLVAGPIVRYSTICEQIDRRKTSLEGFTKGFFRFLTGFNKKILLANLFAVVADKAFGMQTLDAGMAWLGAICYTYQIFFDFSGYSDMAIGLGRMFGFEFLENFDYPYLSRGASEFWRRWHISLGTWFRDYVYFPLGGSRVASRWRLVFNLAVVWMLTGVWHGANWTFILWGVLWGVLIIGEKLSGKTLTWPVTMFVVVIGWVLFRSPDIVGAGHYISAMFGGSGGWWSVETTFWWRETAVVLSVGAICSAKLLKRFSETFVANLFQVALLAVSFSFLSMNAHNPFIYFNF